MEAGKLDKRIGLYRPVTSTNAAGETVEAEPALVATVWAEVRQPNARELLRNGITEAQGDYVVTIRHIAGIDETWTIAYGGRMLHIGGIVPIGRNQGLEIRAAAGAA